MVGEPDGVFILWNAILAVLAGAIHDDVSG